MQSIVLRGLCNLVEKSKKNRTTEETRKNNYLLSREEGRRWGTQSKTLFK